MNRVGYALSWHDEFDGTALDTTKWNVSIGGGGGNNELQIYAANDVYVTNGTLVLESDKLVNNGQTTYTSGKVTSAGKFDQAYGWFEWRGQIPAGRGLWPAYWMLNYVSWPPEIDVMETIGTATTANTMSLHWGPLPPGCIYPWDCGHTENSTYYGPDDFSADFHTFAVDWEPAGATFYIDGTPRFTAGYLGNCTNNMFLIMNTAVGGNWPGSPDSTTSFPAYNRIDYVRVFKPLAGRYPLLNPSFEAGADAHDFDNWNTYDSGNLQSDPNPANARSGNRAVQIWGRYTGANNTTGLYQDLWAAGGETWQASIWARNRPGDIPQGGNQASLKLEFWDNAGNLLAQTTQTILTSASPTSYQQFTVTGLAPFGAQRARIVLEYLQTANGGGSVDFDDASLAELVAPPNILTNGGFESFLAGWTPYGASWTNYAVKTGRATALDGTNYFKVFGQSSGAGNYSGAYQDLPANAGNIYSASGAAFTSSADAIAAGNQAWLEVTFRDANTNILALYRSAILDSTMPQNTWLDLAVTNEYNPGTYAETGSVSQLVAPPGTHFVRCQIVFYQPASGPAGSVYFDQLSLAQAGVTAPPTITAISPDGTLPFSSAANMLTFTVSSPTALAANSIRVLLNGLDFSSQLTAAGASNIWNVSVPGLAPNLIYSATIIATNGGGAATTSFTFDTFSQTGFTIEAEDFDFSSGQFIDDPIPAASAAPNSYFGRVGVNLVDEFSSTSAGGHAYRPADNIGTEVTGDFLRQKFYAAQQTNAAVADYDVGWWSSGAWLNYTRTVPPGNYRVYARLAGGSGNYNVRLDQVTIGRGTTIQTKHVLGNFSAVGRGWQTWDWVPLLTTGGAPVIVPLSGVSTLRATTSGTANANFYMLVPAAPAASLSAIRTAASTALSVPTQSGFSYLILSKNNLADPNWQVLKILAGDGTVQSFNDSYGGAQRFYTVVVQ